MLSLSLSPSLPPSLPLLLWIDLVGWWWWLRSLAAAAAAAAAATAAAAAAAAALGKYLEWRQRVGGGRKEGLACGHHLFSIGERREEKKGGR